MANDAVVQQSAHGAELFVARYSRIDSMELPEIDLLDAELPEAAFGLCNQIRGASIGDPLVRTRTRQTRLGRDKQLFIGVKRLADQFLRNIGTVTVGGVDEVDADLMKPAQRRKRCATVRRRTPDARAGETHRAIAETVDSGLSDLELTGGSGIDRPHDRELQEVNIAFFDFVSWAGTSACMTSQCSTSRPLSTRKMSTATIGSGAQPT